MNTNRTKTETNLATVYNMQICNKFELQDAWKLSLQEKY
jgi:hypothetical protein